MSQPYLHDLVCAVRAPGLAISGPDGQIRAEGVHGAYVGDFRVLSRAVLTIGGTEPVPLSGHPVGAGQARFVATPRTLGDDHADPTVLVIRHRRVLPDGLAEEIEVISYAQTPVRTTVELRLSCDLADMADVRRGSADSAVPAKPEPDGLRWPGPGGTVVRLTADVPPASVDASAGRLEWPVALAAGQAFRVALTCLLADHQATAVIPAQGPAFVAPQVRAGDHRLAQLVAQSVADLDGLLLADPLEPGDAFLAAGVPWYLTLFGRDSIWAARMLLPLGTSLAAGTLRALARRQGTRADPETAEQPGKIMHEIRPAGSVPLAGRLPPLYYGTVDATLLWISLLHDAWRWGLPATEVRELLPALEAALGWLENFAVDRAGFVSYHNASGNGLANQGWKDSFNSVQFRDGTLASPPIALCEVQAYAHAAAVQGADLLDAFGRPGGSRWREWAAALAHRFRERFWTPGGYPAIALDSAGRPVDTLTSNIGHLLGTGLLSDAEAERVAALLASPELDSGYGLRTMASGSAGFNPVSYHLGSVWPHDTAIVLAGLAATPGTAAATAAVRLLRGLLTAAPAFGYRLPELFGGQPPDSGSPVPYPASCRPQAWSAAGAIVMITALLGLRPDVPNRTLRLAPMRPPPVGELTVSGLRVGGEPLKVRLAADGEIDAVRAPGWLRVEVAPR